jgi:hypothetical protein
MNEDPAPQHHHHDQSILGKIHYALTLTAKRLAGGESNRGTHSDVPIVPGAIRRVNRLVARLAYPTN